MPGDDHGRGTGAQTAPKQAASAEGVDSHADTAMDGAHDETLVGEGTETRVREGDELVGTTLQKRYTITRKLGQGGMGAVYEATHLALGKKVAVKVLLDKYTNKDRIVARLEQEARLASSIGHDNIVDITDFGETATGRTFVVMEYLEGESLGQLISREGALEESRSIRIARQVASALGAAHEKGIVHRDIKPENVFLRHRHGRDVVKVVDFGISKTLNKPEQDGGVSPRLTQTGMVLGTPLYMSPEQARGDEDPDHRIDVYSLGVIMYEMATGEVPFRGGNYLNIVSQVISAEPTTPRELNPEVSIDFEAVILKALEKEPEDRYQTMEALEADLSVIDDGELGSTSARITASRRRRKRNRTGWIRVLKWAGAAAVILSLVIIAVTLFVGRGKNKEQAAAQTPVVTPDAAVEVGPPVDAAPPRPDYEMVEVKITSRPSGATILRDGSNEVGKTPLELKLVKKDKKVEFVAEFEGYDYAAFSLNPLETQKAHIKLKKPVRRPPKRYDRPKKGKGAGSERKRDPRHDNGGGDLIPLGGGD
jgi:tRNA A-37 threonylcarbamoyl transferase component Bud32